MLAFERIEPFGGMHDEFMAGQLCALLANVHRDPKKGDPFAWWNFMPASAKTLGKDKDAEPVLLDDPDAQGQLLKAAIFGGIKGG